MMKRMAGIVFTVALVIIYIIYPIFLNIFASGHTPNFLGFNESSRDISDLVDDLKDNGNYTIRTVVTTPSIFEQNMVNPENTLYISVGVEREYTNEEKTAIQNFVKEGGHAIIADDFGYASGLADRFNITYYTGQFYDQHFDKNINFPICEATLGIDRGQWVLDREGKPNSAGQKKEFTEEKDGVWDDDDDKDGFVDEDVLDKVDNDQDNRDLIEDMLDNDYDDVVDESNEGIDEDMWDDDGDWIDENGNGRQEPYEIGVNEEWLDGMNNDKSVFLFEVRREDNAQEMELGYLPEEVRNKFQSLGVPLSNTTTEITTLEKGEGWQIKDGGWHFEVRPSGDSKRLLFYKIDEMTDEDIFHYQIIMNTPVALYSFRTVTNVIARGSANSYVDLNNNGEIELPDEDSTKLADRVSTASNRVELIIEVVDPEFTGKGSIVFMSDADIFTNDLYSLDHQSIDYDSITHTLEKENDVNPSAADKNDPDKLADKTGDNQSDYDNKKFMQDLIFYLFYEKMDKEEKPEILILVDDSRHEEDAVWLKPTYATLKVTSVLTSELCYVLVTSIFLFIGLLLLVVFARGENNWVHRFNVRTFKRRGMIPTSLSLKKSRLRRVVLEKVRMDRGLSPEEFREVDPTDIDKLIGHPQLVQLVRDDKIAYTEDDVTRLIEIINKWKK